jgi:hypothetical protein
MSRFKIWVTSGTLVSLLGLMALAAAPPAGAGGLGGDPRGVGQRTGVVQATLQLRPTSGPAGTSISVRVSGLGGAPCLTHLDFLDAYGIETTLEALGGLHSFKTHAAVPSDAPSGAGTILVKQAHFYGKTCDRLFLTETSATFTVTP